MSFSLPFLFFYVLCVFHKPNGYLALEACCFCKALSLRDGLSESIPGVQPYHVTCSDGKVLKWTFTSISRGINANLGILHLA